MQLYFSLFGLLFVFLLIYLEGEGTYDKDLARGENNIQIQEKKLTKITNSAGPMNVQMRPLSTSSQQVSLLP